ncbi:hypothetical protein [Corynebacterium kefirresidentii]|uniref:hypothetical protein n=1 Tax=Corynebacterium kefirresidentii TaxID=1979527 RepID=UPI0020060F1D|nr:hypothetical protein [Corynebacterium kefirresidentii]
MTNPFDFIADRDTRYFTHRGINCINHMGPFTINGYVELPENHPWLNEGDLHDFNDVDVHGGITYHEGRVIGFDTNHLGEGHHPEAQHANPKIAFFRGEHVHAWTWAEVEEETRKLADQAKDANHA